MIIIWFLHGVPLSCGIPVLIEIVFRYLTYHNIRQTIVLSEEHADHQLTKMISIQVVLIIVSITPSAITTRIIKNTD
jgi:hypothetical protein